MKNVLVDEKRFIVDVRVVVDDFVPMVQERESMDILIAPFTSTSTNVCFTRYCIYLLQTYIGPQSILHRSFTKFA